MFLGCALFSPSKPLLFSAVHAASFPAFGLHGCNVFLGHGPGELVQGVSQWHLVEKAYPIEAVSLGGASSDERLRVADDGERLTSISLFFSFSVFMRRSLRSRNFWTVLESIIPTTLDILPLLGVNLEKLNNESWSGEKPLKRAMGHE